MFYHTDTPRYVHVFMTLAGLVYLSCLTFLLNLYKYVHIYISCTYTYVYTQVNTCKRILAYIAYIQETCEYHSINICEDSGKDDREGQCEWLLPSSLQTLCHFTNLFYVPACNLINLTNLHSSLCLTLHSILCACMSLYFPLNNSLFASFFRTHACVKTQKHKQTHTHI